jgi:anti-anti-sigma regulatory factor
MAIVLTQDETESAIALDDAIDISAAAELKAALLTALGNAKPVRVSLAAAVYLDVTAVQLLWAAGRQARGLGVDFEIAGPIPDAVSSALADAGFQILFNLVQAG